jgi:hypothetical protein
MTVGHNGINIVRNGRAVWEPNPCGTPHHDYPDTRCTEPAGHYRPDRDPHAGPLIVDGREVGAAAWDEPKGKHRMSDTAATQAAKLTGSPPGIREVRIQVQAPSDENAGQWAATIRDLVLAEYGDSMHLGVTILPGEQS